MSVSDDETGMSAYAYWGGVDSSTPRPPTRSSNRAAAATNGGPREGGSNGGTATAVGAQSSTSVGRAKTLQELSMNEAAQLVDEDDSDLDSLSPSLKLVKALQVLSNAFFVGAKTQDGAAELRLETYAKVASLLSGAIKDFADFSAPAPAPDDNNPMAVFRQMLDIDARRLAASGATLDHPAFASVEERDLLGLFHQNALLSLAALQPDRYLDDEETSNGPAAARSFSPAGPTPHYIENLPAEILISIFTLAREAAAVTAAPPAPLATAYGFDVAMPSTPLPKNALEGSKSAALRFAVGLSLVCRKWMRPARAVAFQNLYVRKGPTLVALNKLLATSEAGSLGDQVTSIDVAIVPTGAENSNAPQSAGARSSPFTNPQFDLPEVERDAEAGFAALVKSAPNLNRLKLVIKTGRGPASNSLFLPPSRSQARGFLDGPVFDTLIALPSLRFLALSFVIDFGDFEAIIQGLPLVEELQLAAIDNFSGTATVASSAAHPARSIRTFRLGADVSHGGYHQMSTISPQQLTWILEPSARSGSLQHINLTILTDYGGRHGGGQPAPPAFAGAPFADLLVQIGSTLKTLTMIDIGAAGTTDPSLLQAPHGGFFDYALHHLTSLRKLALGGVYTGTNFLGSVAPMTNLRRLSLIGPPANTSASACADALEANWEHLKTFRVSSGASARPPAIFGIAGAGAGAGATVWTGAERRRIKEIGQRKGFVVEL
ncbi:hypothetical protein JCM6882_006900 [Rhodosporidiobolus microsporus]